MNRIVQSLVVTILVCSGALQASAGVIFVGSWQVDQGPIWTTNPATYTGQEAAALLFGGSPTDYFISTIDNNVANIDHMAWYSVWGEFDGAKYSENYKLDLGQPGYNDPSGLNTAISAYVWDSAIGASYTNFAFRVTTPEPSGGMIFAIASLGACWYRRRSVNC